MRKLSTIMACAIIGTAATTASATTGECFPCPARHPDSFSPQQTPAWDGPEVEKEFAEAMALYDIGDAECLDMLREFAANHPESPLATEAERTGADWLFFSGRYPEAYTEYTTLGTNGLHPANRPVYDYRRALSAAKCGLYPEARGEFEALAGSKEFGTAAIFYIAYCDYAEGKLDKAAEGFREVEKRLGDNPQPGLDTQYYLAQIDYLQGRWDEAYAKASAILSAPHDARLEPEMQRVAGLSAFRNGDYDTAGKYLSEYIRHEDVTPAPDALYALGALDYAKGDYGKASARFSQLTEGNDAIAQSACLYLGQIAAAQGDDDAAAVSFEKASKMNFDQAVTETAMYNYVTAKTRGGKTPFSSAVPLLEGFLKLFPRSEYAPEVEGYLAVAWFREHDYEKALESIRRIENPTRDVLAMKQKTLYELGASKMADGKASAASCYLREGASLDYDKHLQALTYLWLGDAEYALGRHKEAETAYRQAAKNLGKGDNRTLALYNLAYSLMMQGRYAEAEKGFLEALKAKPALPGRLADDALLRTADAQYYTGDYISARGNYAKIAEKEGTDADYASFRHAVMLGLGGDIKGKLRELSEIPERWPGSKWLPNALLETGQTYIALGDTERAVAAFESLRGADMEGGEARKGMLNLAIAYFKAGETAKGESVYREIVSKWPTSEESRSANDDLRRHYAATGGLQEYSAFLNSIEGAPKLDNPEMDSLTFDAAETLFAGDGADTSLLEKYVADFPDGVHVAQALLDIAEGKMERGDADGAADAWRRLEKCGGHEYAAVAWAGIMRATQDPEEKLRYALLVKNSGGISAEMLEEAEYHEASAALSAGSGKGALATLRRLAENPRSLYGARSAVELGEHFLKEGDAAEAERVLTEFTDAGSPHAYWLARGFIALADAVRKRGKEYLAVEYIKSLRDNYPGDEPDIHEMIATRLKKWK